MIFPANRFRDGLLSKTGWHRLWNGLAALASPAFTGVPTAPTAAVGTNTTQVATLAFVIAEILARRGANGGLASLDSIAKVPIAQLPTDVADGVPKLDSNAKILASQLPASVLGSLSYQATWNADTNTPTIPAAAAGNKGWFYKVSVAGATSIDGINEWGVGDWIVSNGSTWDKIDNTDAIISVAGLTGTITGNQLVAAMGALTKSGTFFDNRLPRMDGVNGALQASDIFFFDDGTFYVFKTNGTAGTAGVFETVDAGGDPGPNLQLLRRSASPVAGDKLGMLDIWGRDSAANDQVYAQICGAIVDPTSASEDGALDFNTVVAGVLARRMMLGQGLLIDGATGGDPGPGKINAAEYRVNGVPLGLKQSAVVTASGVESVAAGIDAAAKRIVIECVDLSLTGTSVLQLRLGTGGALEATGYVGDSVLAIDGTATNKLAGTTGFGLGGGIATRTLRGHIILTKIENNDWVASWHGTLNAGATITGIVGSGVKSLAGAIDRIGFVSANGADTFDGGKFKVTWET